MPPTSIGGERTWKAHLELANNVRTERAGLKRDIAAWKLFAEDLISDHEVDGRVASMRAMEFLQAVPYIGEGKARRALVHLAQASPTAKLSQLTKRQRGVLVTFLEEHRTNRGRFARAA